MSEPGKDERFATAPMADYAQRDDWAFGPRFMLTGFVSVIPVWVGILISVWLQLPLLGLIAVLGVTLLIPFTALAVRFRWAECPSCRQKVRVVWTTEFRRGGMLKYTCDHCRIIWSTHFFAGSDT